jgi:anthranilate phosphoribosyltransferase
MASARELLESLLARRDLSQAEAGELLARLTEPELPAVLAGGLLTALRAKGVTADEVRGIACAMRALALKPALPAAVAGIDLVGTGGDASGSFNLSTGAALLTAACGVPVIKHGNRSITSRCGSADVIEALGLTLPLDEQGAARCLAATGFTFLFAPYYHPAMKALAAVRTALGVRTVFNLLGPLTNPAAPPYQLIGAYDAPTAELLAHTLAGMPIERAWVMHGAAGWDEATPIGPFLAFDVSPGEVRRLEVDPLTLGLPRCRPEELKGGDARANRMALEAVFEGRERGAHRDALVLQAALALHVARRAASLAEGVQIAAGVLDSGRAAQWLVQLRAFAARGDRA